jgi:hypothetical protein
LVLNSNSEIGSYLLYKATGIFTNFSLFLFSYFKGLKLKQFLKQLNRKKKVSCRGPNWAESGPSGHSPPAPPQGQAGPAGIDPSSQQPSRTPSFCFFFYFFPTRGTRLPGVSSTSDWEIWPRTVST